MLFGLDMYYRCKFITGANGNMRTFVSQELLSSGYEFDLPNVTKHISIRKNPLNIAYIEIIQYFTAFQSRFLIKMVETMLKYESKQLLLCAS